MNNCKILFYSLFLLFGFAQCNQSKFKEGDILFASISCGPLCDAINKVTDGYAGKDYNHCALVVKHKDTLCVVEAIGNKVQYNSIQKFYARVGDTTSVKNVLHMRLQNEYKNLIKVASIQAQTYVGQPYDDAFILNNNKMYCSEVVYEAFKFANAGKPLFTCNPMTYKDPETKQFFEPWVEYYKQLAAPIPEGEQGINPGGISKSNYLKVVE